MLSILKPKQAVEISPSIVIFTTFFLLGLYFLFYIRSIVILVFLSFVLMTALHPSIKFMTRKLRFPKVLSIVIMYALVVALIVTAIAAIVPPLVAELQLIASANTLPIFQPLQEEILTFKLSLRELGTVVTGLGTSLTTAFNIASSAFSGILTFFTLIVLSFYMLLDRDNLYKRVAWFTKDEKTLNLAKEYVDNVEEQLGGWVRGQSVLMLVIGLVSYLGLLLLGVPFALPLALLAGLLEVLPNLGPTIAALPAIVLAFIAHGPAAALFTTLFYIVVQQLENHFIVPKVMKDNADVSPLATIVMILIGVKVAGVVGALLSVPVYIIIRSFYSLWFHQRKNLV